MPTKFSYILKSLILALFIVTTITPSLSQKAGSNNLLNIYTNDISVGSMLIDKEGTAWTGTSRGLMTCDEIYNNNTIQKSISGPLASPIHFVFQLKDGRMMVALIDSRNYIFDPTTHTLESVDTAWLKNRGVSVEENQRIYTSSSQDTDAVIAIGNEIYSFDPVSDKITHLRGVRTKIMSVVEDIGLTHLFTNDSIYTFNGNTRDFDSMPLPSDITIGKAAKDRQGRLWVGDRSLYRYNNVSDKWELINSDIIITRIVSLNDYIYVGTNSGLYKYGMDGNLLHHYKNDPTDINGLVSDHIRNLFIDNDSNLWIMYSKSDMSILPPYDNLLSSRHIRQLAKQSIKDDVISLLTLDNDYVLIGTDGNGIYAADALGNEASGILTGLTLDDGENAVTGIFVDSKARIWIGFYRLGLICYDRGKVTRLLGGTSPYSFAEDISGRIFIGTMGDGLYYIDPASSLSAYKVDACNIDWIRQLICKRAGTVLVVGTSDLTYIDTNTLKSHDIPIDANKISLKTYGPANVDSRGLIWISGEVGTNKLEILDLANNTVMHINGLSDIVFSNIVEDDYNTMWLTTGSDIYNVVVTYNPVDNTYDFRHYVYRLKSNENRANNYNLNSYCKLSDGSIVFGGANGFQVVNPSLYAELGLKHKPNGILSGIKVNNELILPGHEYNGKVILAQNLQNTHRISLSHDQNSITLELAPRDYASPINFEYFYRVNRNKAEWRPIIGNTIEMSNLAPGKYNLEVCVRRADGSMSQPIDSLIIEIRNPWYRTITAYLVYLLFIVALIFIIVRYYNARQKQRIRLEQTKKEMERQIQLNENKLQFFTNISHDLRTPLTLIITPIESYLDEHPDDGKLKFLKTVHNNALRLLNMVNQVLDFRKLELTGTPLNLSYGDLVAFLRDVADSFMVLSDDNDIKLEIESDIQSLNMYFDKDKLSKVMMNLLSNAFKFTDQGGLIRISVHQEKDKVEISVSDTGKGISDNDKAHIFDRFYQADNSNRQTMGCGIGLHIVKEYVRLHNGTVTVSDNSQQGSIFTVSLPIVKTVKKGVDTLEINDVADQAISVDSSGAKPALLLVEDNPEFLDFMRSTLSNDYTVYTAVNGKAALEVLKDKNVDVIVSDVMMPEMDGFELCKAVKSDIYISHIPLILLTAKSLAEDELRGLELGADDYITKPFKMPILRQRISKQLDFYRRRHEKFQLSQMVVPSEITITSIDEKFLADAIKAVEDNIENAELSVEMLSELLGMHRTHLYRKLSCITGKTPIEFIRHIRLGRAVQYLKKSQLYISEIAYKVGFNNPRLFSRYFKEEFNMTPREYLNSLKNEGETTIEEDN